MQYELTLSSFKFICQFTQKRAGILTTAEFLLLIYFVKYQTEIIVLIECFFNLKEFGTKYMSIVSPTQRMTHCTEPMAIDSFIKKKKRILAKKVEELLEMFLKINSFY